jgi:hypothetical protein
VPQNHVIPFRHGKKKIRPIGPIRLISPISPIGPIGHISPMNPLNPGDFSSWDSSTVGGLPSRAEQDDQVSQFENRI